MTRASPPQGTLPLSDPLARALVATEPRARLVAPELVGRVIRVHRRVGGFGFKVDHAHGYVLGAAELARLKLWTEIAPPFGSGGAVEAPGPLAVGADQVLLIARPEDELAEDDGGPRWLWQRLFELRVEAACLAPLVTGQVTPAGLRARIHQVGQTEFDEVRAVLRAQQWLLPPRTGESRDALVWAAFAGRFLTLRRFAPETEARWFPSLRGRESEVETILGADLDAAALLEATRPPGAPRDPAPREAAPEVPGPAAAGRAGADGRAAPPLAAARGRRLLERAERARAGGNLARALRLAALAARAREAEIVAAAAALAATSRAQLAARLARLVGPEGPSAATWETVLAPLARVGGEGFERAEARLLYELQRACDEKERPVHRVDVVAWVRSFGRRPVRRPLPFASLLQPCRRLRAALAREGRCGLPAAEREALMAALRRAAAVLEARLRAALEGALRTQLASGLGGDSVAERLGRARLTAELADRVIARGFVGYGDLRDAVARGSARLADVGGPGNWLRGDALLRTDARLAEPTEGVYRPGEIYLRGLQRGSALLFGTRLGRLVTRGLVLPGLGSFVVLEGLQHLLGPLLFHTAGLKVHFTPWWALGGLAVFLLLVINVAPVRRTLGAALRATGRAVSGAVGALWRGLRHWPPLRRIWDSRAFGWLCRWVCGPALLSAPVLLTAGGITGRWRLSLAGAGALHVAVALLASSAAGRRWGARAADALGRTGRRFVQRTLPGLLRLVLDVFEALLEGLERVLFRVDEWLRYRPGDPRSFVAVKALLGLGWSAVSYVLRFYVNLLIEPQVNPVKHFPVVTVSHKIILPMTFTITEFLRTPLAPLGTVLANFIAVSTVFLLPGIFGFLVWELKENWRLYAANRPEALEPVTVGSHGETVGRLLRPGFHSGTLPKHFRRLRRSARRATQKGDPRALRRLEAERHHLEEALHRFVERDLLWPFAATLEEPSPGAPSGGPGAAQAEAQPPGSARVAGVRLAEVRLGSNQITLRLVATPGPEAPSGLALPALELRLDEQSGWIVAGVADRGLREALAPATRTGLEAALAGFFAQCGADLLRPRIEAALPAGASYDVADEGLVVWPDGGYQREWVYSLAAQGPLPGRVAAGELEPVPVLTRADLSLPPVSWRDWQGALEPGGDPLRVALARWTPRETE